MQNWPAERVRAERKKYKLNQKQLSRLLGCRQQTVSEWEVGNYAPKNAYQRLLDQVFAELKRKSEEK